MVTYIGYEVILPTRDIGCTSRPTSEPRDVPSPERRETCEKSNVIVTVAGANGLVGMCASATADGQVEKRRVKIDHPSLTFHSLNLEEELHLTQVREGSLLERGTR